MQTELHVFKATRASCTCIYAPNTSACLHTSGKAQTDLVLQATNSGPCVWLVAGILIAAYLISYSFIRYNDGRCTCTQLSICFLSLPAGLHGFFMTGSLTKNLYTLYSSKCILYTCTLFLEI